MTEEKEQEPSIPTQSDTSEPNTSLSSEERNWGMACHLSALIGFLVPFGSIVGPLVVWLIKRNESSFIDANGKEAVNFQITVAIAFIVSAILTVVVIGLLLMLVVGIGALVMTIIAAIKASNGEEYKYPFALRLIS